MQDLSTRYDGCEDALGLVDGWQSLRLGDTDATTDNSQTSLVASMDPCLESRIFRIVSATCATCTVCSSGMQTRAQTSLNASNARAHQKVQLTRQT
jgi:hypothetical protein